MAKSIKKNFSYNLLYQLLTFVMPLITTPYLSRVLGAEKTGSYSYAYSISYCFVLFAMLGLNNYGNREIAKVRDDMTERSKKFWSIYFLQFTMAVIVFIVYCGYCIFSHDVVQWAMALYVLSASVDINWFFWGLEEFKITVTRNIVIKLITVALILLLVKTQDDLLVYTTIMSSGFLVSSLALLTYLKKRVQWVKPELKEVMSHIKPNLVLFIPVIAVSLYKVMDKIMLGNMASKIEVGFYDYSEKVIAIPTACVNALGVVMMPHMSNLVAKNETSIETDMIRKSMVFGVALATSMCFGLMAIADLFVPIFYGVGYEKCITLFYILLPSCVFLAIANVIRTQYLIPHAMDKEFTISLMVGAITNLSVNAMLIPGMKSVGAAIGTLIAELCVCICQVMMTKERLPLNIYLLDVLYIIGAGVVMMVVVLFVPMIGGSVVTLVLKICVGGVVFSVLMFVKYRQMMMKLLNRDR